MTFKPQPKQKRVKDRKYLDWVDARGCVVCGKPSKAHHLCNYGRGKMGGKDHDYLTFALCSKHHMAWFDTGIHFNVNMWELEHGTQPEHIIITLQYAAINGLISITLANKYIDKCNEIKDYRS